MERVQVIIVGQGFAGTAVAWSLAMRGIRFAIIDSGIQDSSSRIAAGLVTPITGKRLVKTWQWDEAWNQANRFYREIEKRTNARFWSVQPALRLFDNNVEQMRMEADWPKYPELLARYRPIPADAQVFDLSYGGIELKLAARLNGPTYLNASREIFQHSQIYYPRSLDLNFDVVVDPHAISIPSLGIQSEFLVLCQGYGPEKNPWFPKLPMVPAQGDILTIDISNFNEMRTIHRGIWLTPLHNEPRISQMSRYLIGSTYHWHPLDGLPSDEARQEILSKFSRWFKLPFEVVNHRSAIRPTSFDQRPLLGASSIETRIWVLNGLGAKGSLLAPWCAEQLVNCMMDRADISPSLSWNRRHL